MYSIDAPLHNLKAYVSRRAFVARNAMKVYRFPFTKYIEFADFRTFNLRTSAGGVTVLVPVPVPAPSLLNTKIWYS